ncbi:MAG: hypothetical protein KGZ82_05760 [Bacteroidales bacterium]|nr:hypothetical protein [Bacteroidales bacterium]
MKLEDQSEKIKILLKIFGTPVKLSEALGVNPAQVIRWRDSGQGIRDIYKMAEVAKISIIELKGPLKYFKEAISRANDITLDNAEEKGLLMFFSRTLNAKNNEIMLSLSKELSGNYYAYCYWRYSKELNQELILKLLINIGEYDKSSNVIKVKMLADDIDKLKSSGKEWDYEGVLIAADDSMYFIFEIVEGRFNELAWIITNAPEQNFELIPGILSAPTRMTGEQRALPAATRIVLKKSDDDLELAELQKGVSKNYTSADIAKEDKGNEIINLISNEISDKSNILMKGIDK